MQQLIMWQQEKARQEHLEPYMVLQFNTIKEIVRLQPKTNADLLRIKGIGHVKIRKYGDEILGIVRSNAVVHGKSEYVNYKNHHDEDLFSEARRVNEIAATPYNKSEERVLEKMNVDHETGEVIERDSTISVTEFVTMLDTMLQAHFQNVRIKGEVVGFKRNASGHAYFEIKDNKSVLRCMVFSSRYEISGVLLVDGMEVIVTGHPNYHRQYGFGFVGTMIELYGEGALKKAYDLLKKTLAAEGMFSLENKRVIPYLPTHIGLITSRTGAALGDFMTNVGKYGYKISFCHSRVEGAQAVDDLIEALTMMMQQKIDVLVIVRGGGSLESLQAFNNERIVRMIATFPVPVVVGVGHEQDETLVTLVADKGVSTPTAAARVVRESWDQYNDSIQSKGQNLVHAFEKMLRISHDDVNGHARYAMKYIEDLTDLSQEVFRSLSFVVQKFEYAIENRCAMLRSAQQSMMRIYERRIHEVGTFSRVLRIFSLFDSCLTRSTQNMRVCEKILLHHDPQRNLTLGYCIVRDANGNIVRTKKSVSDGDKITVYVCDGVINADVRKSS